LLLAFHKYASRFATFVQGRDDFPALMPELVESPDDCVQPQAVNVQHFDPVFPIHFGQPSPVA
jgi:hypothetical protein